MAEVLQFIGSWWGLVVAVILLVGYAIYDWGRARKLIASMIFHAEERARELMLENGEAKFNWVKENTYPMLPKWVKFLLTEDMYKALIQKVFDELKEWATTRPLPKK
mgnify:FL=1